jgi:hypothetical protein
MLMSVLLLAMTAPSIRSQESGSGSVPYVTLYKEEGFRGESEKFLIGEYAKLEGGWKDEAKSIALVGGVRAQLFDKERFEGKKLVVENSLYKIEGDFRGETASMIVEPFECQYVIAYKNTIFRGNSKTFQIGEYPKLTDGWDDMQSVDLCGKVSVTLFKDENFEGESQTITSDRIDLGKFRKNVESMRIEAAPQ